METAIIVAVSILSYVTITGILKILMVNKLFKEVDRIIKED